MSEIDRLQSDLEDAKRRLSALENELSIIEHQLFMAALQEDAEAFVRIQMRRVRLPSDINGAALSATELELALNEAQRQAATKELEEARRYYQEKAPRYLAGDEVAEAIQRLRRAEDNLENLETEHQELVARRVKLIRESRQWTAEGNT